MIVNETTTNLNAKNSSSSFFLRYGLAIVTAIMMMLFTLIEPKFLSINNLMNILDSDSLIAISAMGLTIIFCAGEIDFAAGMEVTVTAVMLAMLPTYVSFPVAVIITFCAIILFGLINAYMNIKVGIPAFIATMGTSLIAQGIAYHVTKGSAIYSPQNWPSSFLFIGQGYLFDFIPMPVVILVVISIIMWVYAEKTKNGKTMYAVGSNPTTCKYIGIDPRKEKLKGFIICAVLCGISGVIICTKNNGATYTMGNATLIQGLTAIMLGATFLHPGVINIPGTLLGSLFISILTNGFIMISAPTFAMNIIQGLVMLIAVSALAIIHKRTGSVT